MDQRVAFIADWLRGEWTMTELAARYGVSRKTGYKWTTRDAEAGGVGLLEQSRAPKVHGRAHASALRDQVLALRRRYPHWGPKKLRALLQAREPTLDWPAASTMGMWLAAAGLSAVRRRSRTLVPLTQPLATVTAPNDLWTADFKGWFRTGDGTRCDPLTVIDAHSRFVLGCQITAPTERGVRPWFERLFALYGMPRALRTDNGPPFAGHGPGRLTHLAVWWLKLGIQVERIAPGHPDQNGRHERFHRTLQQEATVTPAATPRAQQQRFDRLRREFNTVRPHEALGQQPPARLYRPSGRRYPSTLVEPWYDATHQVRRVRPNGQIKWQGQLVFVSEAMRREVVGLAETERGDWLVRFMHLELGRIDRHTLRFTPSWHGRRRG